MMIFISFIFPLLFTIYSIPCESLKCYECTEYVACGQEQPDLTVDCSGKCMVYRNQFDNDTIIRRCCTNDCGTEDGLHEYEGRHPAYFCSEDFCNGIGAEAVLTGGTVPTPITPGVTSLTPVTITTATTTVAGQSSVQCYDCSGPNCGKEGSTLSMNCPSCMIYRNPDDQTIFERRCCLSSCGAPFSVGKYNGIQTYFCSYDKCNKYGAETILSPPVITTGGTTITTSTTTSTTYSTPSCTLNCQNGGTLETENGCFCYCVEKTNGLECENIDCIQPDDDDPGVCVPENASLCDQSEIFASKCLHMCGKC